MRRPTLRASALAVVSLLVCFPGVGGSQSDEAAAASASGKGAVPGDTLQAPNWFSDALRDDESRVRRWHDVHVGLEQAENQLETCPASWNHFPESKRRILQVNDTTTYSGYNYPGSEGPEDRVYVLPSRMPPPPAPPPASPPSLSLPSAPPLPPFPSPIWPDLVVEALAFRNPPSTLVDLVVDYSGGGAKFRAVDRYYFSTNSSALEVTDFNLSSVPFESIRHTQITDVPDTTGELFVRLADERGAPVSAIAEIPIATGSHMSWGPGNAIRVQVRTLWELVSAMRDTSVTVIELRRHIGLIGHPLPRIERGRDLTIVGVCDNEAGAKNVTALYDASSKRRRLAQVKHASATKNVYTGAHGDLFGPESEMLLRKHIAEILGVQGILNETTPFVLDPIALFPVYQSDLSPSSDVSTRSNDIFPYKKGTRFLVQRGVEYFAQGTVYAFGGDAFGVGPLGGAAMYVAANWVDVPVEHTFLVNITDPDTGITGAQNVTNTTTVRTYVVPLHDRCVIDGLGTTTLFSVGNETAAACRWPQPRPARRRRSFGAATASLADVSVRGNGNGRSKRWFDDSAGSDAVDDFSDHGFVVTTATGGHSPWGRSSGGDANETAESDTNECGRLNLKGLVLRGGWSGTKNGVAVSNFGGEVSIAGCVVERHRTGVGSGRGGAVANRGGSVEILHSIFRENIAARGSSGLENATRALTAKDPGNNLFHYHSGSLRVDENSRFDGKPWRVTTTEETGR